MLGVQGAGPLLERPDIDGRPLARRLSIAAAIAVIAAAVCYLLFVHTTLGQRFDNEAYLGSQQSLPAARNVDNDLLRHITADSFAVVLLILVAIGVLRRRVWLGLAAALAAGIAVVGTDILKKVILNRPFLTASDSVVPGRTFPSGHTATAVACALALMLVCGPRWRGAAAVLAGGYAFLTAAEVQTAGWHRPSDAIGASLLAFASVCGVAAVLAWWRPVSVRRAAPHGVALVILGLAAVGSATTAAWGGLGVIRWLAHHDVGVTDHIRNEAYLTGVSLTVFVAAILVMTLLLLLGQSDLDHVDRPSCWTR